jgi:hypothetical protein
MADVPKIVTNANGTALKYPSGAMICYKNVSFTVSVTSAWGSLYEAAESKSLGNWPVAFISTPVMSVTNVGNNAGWIGRVINENSTFCGNVSPIRPSTITDGYFEFSVIGFGRWK